MSFLQFGRKIMSLLRPINRSEEFYMNDNAVKVFSDKVSLKELQDTKFQWRGNYKEDRELIFEQAFCIERIDWNEGIKDCEYTVHKRRFTDLSFLAGRTIEKYPDDYEIRVHKDRTKFLFSYVSIPTFDSGDRVWDSMHHSAVYCDDEDIILIDCCHGYAIPRIKIYIGLKRSVPALTEWLKLLGCEEKIGKDMT